MIKIKKYSVGLFNFNSAECYFQNLQIMYKCEICGEIVSDRRKSSKCSYSPSGTHKWNQIDFANDTKWSESLVGKHWGKILIGLAIYFILKWLKVF